MTTRFDYYFMAMNGEWEKHLQEVATDGFDNASSIARLIYSCEAGNGIDQHASEDLKVVSAQLAEMREALNEAFGWIEKVIGNGNYSNSVLFLELEWWLKQNRGMK